jgi:BirA family biotin operon repressor/biotin-[acetyl-CoA-carboxylase] ligase
MSIHRIHLDACDSTQEEVRERLGEADPGVVVAVTTDSQRAGRGREGRVWEDAPGGAIMLSVGRRGPLPVEVLDELPRRVADVLLATFGAGDRVAWKAPNDLVDSEDAKLAGILVDARTVGDEVEHVIVGVGLNAGGAAFTTEDGRRATTLEALGVEAPDPGTLVSAIGELLAE